VKLVRPVACAALAASLVAAGTAVAATKPTAKPVCNLVTDPSGDANSFFVPNPGLPVPPSDDYLDVLSADVASDAKALTAVVRLKALGADPTAPTGSSIYFNFYVGDQQFYLEASLDGSGGATYSYGDFTGTPGRNQLGEATGSIVAAKKEIHITAPAKAFTVPIKAGTKISQMTVLGQRFFGNEAAGGATPTADEAASEKSYKVGTLSCVKPGK